MAWQQKSPSKDCAFCCCLSAEAAEHWDLERVSNIRDIPSLESRRVMCSLLFLPVWKIINQKQVCLFAYFPTLRLALEDSAGL